MNGLLIVNKAATNMLQMSLSDPVFNSFGYIPRSGTDELSKSDF